MIGFALLFGWAARRRAGKQPSGSSGREETPASAEASGEQKRSEPDKKLIDDTCSRLKVPSIGLIIYGVLSFLVLVIGLVEILPRLFLVGPGDMERIGASNAEGLKYAPPPDFLMILPMVGGALGAFVIFCARRMFQLRNYGLAVTGSILALVPISIFPMILFPIKLLGMVFGVWALIVLSKKEVREAFESNRKPTVTPKGTEILAEPRFSRTAIVGACWAGIAVLAFVLQNVGINLEALLPGNLLALLAFTAPIGTTILGWIAVSQIRRSVGRIYGMTLAMFDALLFPLLALDALIVWLAIGFKLGFPAAVLLCLPIDAFLIWKVWRGLHQVPSSNARRFGWLPVAGLIALVALICAGIFLTVMVRKQNEARVNVVQLPDNDFTPITEQALYSCWRMEGKDLKPSITGFDLDKNRKITAPDEVNDEMAKSPQDERVFRNWIDENGIDLFLTLSGNGNLELVTSLKMAGMDFMAWEKAQVNDINVALATGLNPFKRPHREDKDFQSYDLHDLRFPQTLAFQTLAGTRGILQFTGLTGDKEGIKVRCKLLQKPVQKPATGTASH